MEPEVKRMRVEHASPGNKLCLVLRCSGHHSRRITEYNVYVVDVDNTVGSDDEKAFIPMSPTLRIDTSLINSEIADAFCVLGDTLYMFEGYYDGEGSRKSVFGFDISDLSTHSTKLARLSDMSFPKQCPVAIPTPDHTKIVVLASSNFTKSTIFGACELFDPMNDSWKPLPPIQLISLEQIDAYGFINDSMLLVQTARDYGLYVLDIDSPQQNWTKQGTIYNGVERLPALSWSPSFFETIEDRFCFISSCGVFDLEEFVGAGDVRDFGIGFAPPKTTATFFQPPPRNFDSFRFTADYTVSLLNHNENKGECNFSQLQIERVKLGDQTSCRLVITICQVDLNSYKAEKSQEITDHHYCMAKRANTRIVKCFRFALNFDNRKLQLIPDHLFFSF